MKRILTAIILILAVFALIFFGQLWMITLFSAIVAELAAYEYLKLASVGAEAHGATLRIPIWWMALGTALAFVVTLPNFPVEAQLPVLSALTLVLFAWNGFRSPLNQVLPDTAQGLFGLVGPGDVGQQGKGAVFHLHQGAIQRREGRRDLQQAERDRLIGTK